MTTRMVSRSLALFAAVAAVVACQRPKELRVPLDYRPTDKVTLAGLEVAAGTRVAVTVVDARTDTSAIGRNSESAQPVPVYAADTAPDGFVRDAVARELAGANIQVATDPHAATKVLTLRLQKFWTEETNTYNTSIQASVELADASGRSLWKGQVAGSTERFGRSLSAENYQEAMSDAVVAMVERLIHDPGFVQALNTAPSRAPAPKRPGRGQG